MAILLWELFGELLGLPRKLSAAPWSGECLWRPWDPTGTPKGPQRAPQGTPGPPKDAPSPPKDTQPGVPLGPPKTPRTPRGPPRTPRDHPETPIARTKAPPRNLLRRTKDLRRHKKTPKLTFVYEMALKIKILEAHQSTPPKLTKTQISHMPIKRPPYSIY